MQLVQQPVTTIVADEGKILVRKKSGVTVGEEITLGYNYYDVGYMLDKPYLDKPEDFEEIDKPEDWEVKPLIPQAKRMERILELLKEERKEFAKRGLTDAEMLQFQDLAPRLGIDLLEGETVSENDVFVYNGTLYKVLKTHTLLPYYHPSAETTELYVEVVA